MVTRSPRPLPPAPPIRATTTNDVFNAFDARQQAAARSEWPNDCVIVAVVQKPGQVDAHPSQWGPAHGSFPLCRWIRACWHATVRPRYDLDAKHASVSTVLPQVSCRSPPIIHCHPQQCPLGFLWSCSTFSRQASPRSAIWRFTQARITKARKQPRRPSSLRPPHGEAKRSLISYLLT